MKNVILPAQVLAAARLAQGEKCEPRYYLRGVYVDKNRIAGTNGRYMFVNDYSSFPPCTDELIGKIEDPVIINIIGLIPASAWKASLTSIDDKKGFVEFFGAKGSMVGRAFFDFVDGKYPDIDRVMPKGEPIPTKKIGINQNYLALAGKIFSRFGRYYGSEMEFFGEDNVVRVNHKSSDYGDLTMLIMPCRL